MKTSARFARFRGGPRACATSHQEDLQNEKMEIKELLVNSEMNMESAYKIEKVFESAKIDVMTKLFEEIEDKVYEKTNKIFYGNADTYPST